MNSILTTMRGARRTCFLTLALSAALAMSGSSRPEARAFERPARLALAPQLGKLLQSYCLKCHAGDEPTGGVGFETVLTAIGKEGRPIDGPQRELLTKIRDQLQDGLMPPPDEPQPDSAELARTVEALTEAIGARAARLPGHGNLTPHAALFGPSAPTDVPPPPRLWRLSPDGYRGFVRDVHRGRADGIVQPFTVIPDRGFKDYAGLYSIDEASTEILLRNAERIVDGQTAHELQDGRVRAKHDTVGEFVKLMDPGVEPTPTQLAAAVGIQFRMAIGRRPDDAEIERFVGLYAKCAADGDRPAAVKTMLQAVLLRADAMYRLELGGAPDESGRRMLAPAELVRAVSLALCDRREPGLIRAAETGELSTREHVAAQVRRILNDPKIDKPGLMRFFREYFEYHRASDVFKDKPKEFKHEPQTLISDTDRLVRHIVDADRDVLRELLTTRLSFVNFATKQNKQTRADDPVRAVQPDPPNKNRPYEVRALEHVYGLDAWPEQQPVELPAETRIGVLMQPSWLIAFSTNFENDPVRRGRWIRERLLGGVVPDLPIGVAAQVPDEKHRTFRERLQVTRDDRCWKCHRRMDDLGLPFEQFDHYGRFRNAETVLDPEATEKNVDRKGAPLGPVLRETTLDVTGRIAESGDERLEGPVKDPREMLQRLAASERVRQVFVRHAFRYFLGRNETLADARTLQEADRAYVESGGSFKTLVVALLTSDSFLLRRESQAP